ncbi:hypothetical protein EV421DRAFT_1912300 [Armillaria borealis]|uniref:Uncharacterized protein n=1 Tax=Armillaria borealis TaxID=47425 RepID=A0AA39IV51_9AGAR|nr:hypothetical protein EV421DRAFT_1912300 [Armillaria borealis]
MTVELGWPLMITLEKKTTSSKQAIVYANLNVVNEYFDKFYWALPVNQDPHEDDPPRVSDKELTEEQMEVKGAIVKQMSNALPKWLDYHSGKATPSSSMSKKKMAVRPGLEFLGASRGDGSTSPALRHFGRLRVVWGRIVPAARATFVAEEFGKLSKEMQAQWTTLAEQASKETKKGRDGCFEGPSLLEPVEAQRVLDTLGSTMGPLIEGLSVMLGCHVTLAVFGPEPRKGGQVNILTLHEGTDKAPVPRCFDQVGGERYKMWLAAMGEYAMSCYTLDEQRARALPGMVTPTTAPGFLRPNMLWVARPLMGIVKTDVDVTPKESNKKRSHDEDESEVETEGENHKQKKKKSGTGKKKGKKQDAVKENGTENMDDGSHPSRPTRGSQHHGVPEPKSSIPGGPSPHRPREMLEDITDILTNIVPPSALSPELNNAIDPALLAYGMAPGSFIPNCGPNDCPNPFATPGGKESLAYAGMHPQPEVQPLEPSSRLLKPKRSDWFDDVRKYLGRFDLGLEWDALVMALTRFEGKSGFKKEGKPLQSKNRPAQVALWIQNARACDPTPLTDCEAFISSSWSWWRGLQPACWDLDSEDGPVVPESRVAGEDWSKLNKSGQNGLYSIVASLAWWGECVQRSSMAREAWLLAVADVCWVFEQLLAISAEK